MQTVVGRTVGLWRSQKSQVLMAGNNGSRASARGDYFPAEAEEGVAGAEVNAFRLFR